MSVTTSPLSLPNILAGAENLPSPPAIALEILRLSADESVGIEDLARVISRDPVLSAKVLKLSNSSIFRRGFEVTTLDRATMLLGLKTVKLMALSFSLAAGLPRTGIGAYDYDSYWRWSLTHAVSARSLGVLTRNRKADEAFLCGLLSRIGQLALNECVPADYAPVLGVCPHGLPDADQERRYLGTDFHEVGAALLSHWGMPEQIINGVRYSSDTSAMPSEFDDATKGLCELMEFATMASMVICDSRKGPALQKLHALAAERFDISASEIDALLIGLQSGIAETATLLNIEGDQFQSHKQIIDTARMQMMQVSIGTAADLHHTTSRAQALERERNELEVKATTDKLTGIRNRAFFDETLRKVVNERRQGMHAGELGLIVMDVDRFKFFNDAHGHATGDEVLKAVARVLNNNTRAGDYCARYGGEEFVAIIPSADEKIVHRVAERIREAIEKETLDVDGKSLSVTISIGGATCAEICNVAAAEALLKIADECLYEAKRTGRNRSVCRSVKEVVAGR